MRPAESATTSAASAVPRWRDLLVRAVMAAAFLAGLGQLLARMPAPAVGPQVRLELPPPLPDPAALVPLAPESARALNAAVPVEAPTAIAPPFRFAGSEDDRARAADCLAAAQWYEAGDDPGGQRAVAQVVLNRARHPAFPTSVCGVVFQGSERRTGCQFTFTCDGALGLRRPSAPAWTRARTIALAALAGAVDPRVGLATHYHADYVVPYWRASLTKLAQVGAHLFYAWPGYWGSPAAITARPRSGTEAVQPLLATLSPAHGAPALSVDPATLADDADLALATGGPPTSAAPRDPAQPPTAADRAERIEVALDPQAFPGSYAVRAFTLCKGKPRCVVLGRIAGGEAANGGRAALSFLYVHDGRSGAEGTWWNCAATPRADRAQCLPEGPAAETFLARWL
ncbi:MAG: hypothetical protein RIS94_980 [Pseudomonadota bacterium]|jgi:hypothetical protein